MFANEVLTIGHPSIPAAATDFDRVCRRIVQGYVSRKLGMAGALDRLDLSADAWLRLELYELSLVNLPYDLLDHVEVRVARYDLRKPGPTGDETLFHKILWGVFVHSPSEIEPAQRRRSAAYLWLAFLHHIPPALLEHFVGSIPQSQVESRARAHQIEPGFDDWIAEQAASDSLLFRFRDNYPDRVKDLIDSRWQSANSIEDWIDEDDNKRLGAKWGLKDESESDWGEEE